MCHLSRLIGLGLSGNLLVWVACAESSDQSAALVECTRDGQMSVGLNIYPPGVPVTFAVRTPAEATGVVLDYEIKDFHGQVVTKGQRSASAPFTFQYKPERNGVYYLDYWFLRTSRTIKEGKETFSVIPPPKRPPFPLEKSPFGVCFALPELMPLAGVHWHRRDFYWDSVEPKQGQFNWEDTDRAVADGEKYGFQLMPIIDYSASWSSTGPPGDPKLWAYPPRLDAWAHYVSAVVSRYKGRVKCWEIWNEPDGIPVFFIGGSPKQYAELLRVAYESAKQVDPSCTIIGGVTGSWSLAFLEGVFRNDGLKYLDVVSVHPYRVRCGSPEATDFLGEMGRLRQFMDKYGGKGKPVWLTEFGWPADDLDPDAHRRIQLGQAITERDQVAYVVRFYTQALSLGFIQRLFWFVFRHPSPNFTDAPDHGESLVYYDYKAKPLLVAHRVMSDLLTGAKPDGGKRFGSSVWSFRFRRGTSVVTTVWCAEGRQLVGVDSKGKPFSAVDVMYNRRRYPATAGTTLLPCDEVPVFLEGDNVRVVGHLLDVELSDSYVSTDSPAALNVALHNPTKRPMQVHLRGESRNLVFHPGSLRVTVAPRQTAHRKIDVSVSGRGVVGSQELSLKVATEGGQSFELTRKLVAVSPPGPVVDDFEQGVGAWRTNGGDAHVEFSEVKDTTERAHDGSHSLWWHCKSNLWNNLFREISGVELAGAKQLEFWVFLPKPAVGNQILTVELMDRAGSLYDYFGSPLYLHVTGKWLRCVMNLSDFRRRVSDSVHDIPPDPTKLGRVQFNYTGGEFEGYIDGIRFRGLR